MLRRRTFLSSAITALVAATTSRSGAQEPEDALAAGGPVRLVLVHGRAQQGKDPRELRASWLDALRIGAQKSNRRITDGMDVAFPFYGDVLEEFTRQAEVPLTSDIQTKGAEVDDGFLAFEAEVAEALRQRAGITDQEVDAEYGTNPKPKGPQNWEWVQAILRTLDKRAGGVTQSVLERFMRDVYLYTSRVRVREEIDKIVSRELTEQPTVLVAHSLGSVVAYSVLITEQRALRVPNFVTVGCPLGIRPIRKTFEPLKAPPNVSDWYNAFDRRDVVALYPLDGTNFNVAPAVENHDAVRNRTKNRHGIDGYLDDRQVAGKILDGLRISAA
jgi:hypothetical protein